MRLEVVLEKIKFENSIEYNLLIIKIFDIILKNIRILYKLL